MQVKETLSEGLKREFKVTVPAKDINERVTQELESLSKTANVPGFRPGKVPVELMRKRYGDAVMGDVLEKTLNESSQKALEEKDVRPVMQPNVEVTNYEKGKDLEYVIKLDVFPEIDDVDFSKLTLERLKVKLEDKDVDETLQRLAESQTRSVPIKEDRPAKDGDVALIDFVGKLDGEPFTGGSAEDYELSLGSGTFIPGFEEQVLGMKKGEEKDIKVTFPEDYGAAELAGKETVFEVKLKEIRETAPAEIDEELAKKVGMESLDELKNRIKEDQAKEYDRAAEMRLHRQLLDQLAEEYSFELPEGMVEQEFNAVWEQVQKEREQNPENLDPEDREKSEKELKEDYRKISERRVRLGLALAEIGRKNNITVSSEDVQQALLKEAQRYPGQEQQVLEYYQNNPEAAASLQGPILEEKVMDYIISQADVTKREVSPEELLKVQESDAGEAKKKSAKKSGGKKSEAKSKDASSGSAAKKASGGKKSAAAKKKSE